MLAQAVVSGTALAQTTPDPDVLIDRAEARADQIGDFGSSAEIVLPAYVMSTGDPVATEVTKTPRWTLTAGTSFTYSDNVNLAEIGKLDSWHSTTSFGLAREIPISGDTKLNLSVRSDMDVLTDHTEFGSSFWTADAKLNFADPKKAINPYVQATSVGIYLDIFGKHVVTTHLFGVGAQRVFVMADTGAFTVDFNVMRREASLVTTELNRVQLLMRYKGPAAPKLTWSISGRLRYLDYSGGAAANREDVQALVQLGLSYELSPAFALNANLGLTRNWSTFAGKSYTNVDVGPSIGFTTKF